MACGDARLQHWTSSWRSWRKFPASYLWYHPARRTYACQLAPSPIGTNEDRAVKLLKIPAALACLMSAACTTTAPPYSGRQMSTYDMSTEYTAEYVPDGFTLMVNYRYQQFTVLPSTAATECRAAVSNVASSVANRWHRQLEQMDDGRVKLNTSRNWFGKVTACSATAPVNWKR